MLAPFVACMVLVAIHSYLGLHVIAREVIFVDLSLAQMAGLGSVVALLYGVAPDSQTAFIFSLVFTCIGAALFALTRTRGKGRVPHEAIIGIVYVAASAAAILVADKAPRGAEALHDVLEGSIIWITWPTIIKKGAAYAALGLIHFLLRKQFLKISFHPDEAEREGWHIRAWDFLFYVSFGVAVTMSVPVACWVRPIAQSVAERGPRAYHSAAWRMRVAGTLVMVSARSGVYGFTASRTLSKSCVRAAMNALSSIPLARMWLSIAFSNATSVPGTVCR